MQHVSLVGIKVKKWLLTQLHRLRLRFSML
jgi:hypothetical protein